MNHPHAWTEAEDAALRRIASPPTSHLRRRARHTLPWAELYVALPDRSRGAIRQRLRTLDLRPTSGRRWSEEESRLLAARWSLVGRRTLLATFPGRSWQAIFEHAMGLGLPSIPQGYETLMAACRRCGIERQTAMTVLAWTRRQSEIVRAIQLWAHAIGARLGMVDCSGKWDQNTWDTAEVELVHHTTSLSSVRNPTRPWLLVAERALDEALTLWQSWETTARAAHRIGVSVRVATRHARRWLNDPTLAPHAPLRLPRAWWDDALRGLARRPEGRSLAEHAARLGVSSQTLERAVRFSPLQQPGKGRKSDHLDAEIDAAWSAYCARPHVAARRSA